MALPLSRSVAQRLITDSIQTPGLFLVGGALNWPAFQNSWVNYGGGFTAAGYWKDATNVVHLQGLVKSGTITATVFTLPAGFRPLGGCIFATVSNAAFAEARVNSDGTVVATSGNNAWYSLDGLAFKVV